MTDHDLPCLIDSLLAAAPWRRAVLEAVASLDLPDGWVAAGFLRNALWDRLHGLAEPTPLNDIDVVYFDPGEATKARDLALAGRLAETLPGQPWSVANQARMHEKNGDRPYRSTEDALEHWLETVSAVGIRLAPEGTIELVAPFGFEDILTLTVRPTPHAETRRLADYRARMAKKNWPAIWPQLRVLNASWAEEEI